MPADFKHVNYSWDDAHAATLDPVARLVYRSNILGDDQRVTNTGGGNTSSKIMEKDPLSGQATEVLWVKGSGGDLRTSKRDNFSSLYQDKLIAMQGLYEARADKGLKSQAEDDMVAMYFHTTFNLNPRASSIDTPLHSFLPGKHVDHMHPNAIIAIAASKNCQHLTKEIFGGEMAYVPWMRPGFELGLAMQEIAAAQPDVKAIMMGQHGFISWDDDDKVCYIRTLEFIEKAAIYIEAKYEAKGVKFLMLNSNLYDTPAAIAEEMKSFGSTIPVLKDADQKVGEPLGVERATETLVIQPGTWKVLYQGPFNDRVTYGRARAKADQQYVGSVVDAMLAGKPVTPSFVAPEGCILVFDNRKG